MQFIGTPANLKQFLLAVFSVGERFCLFCGILLGRGLPSNHIFFKSYYKLQSAKELHLEAWSASLGVPLLLRGDSGRELVGALAFVKLRSGDTRGQRRHFRMAKVWGLSNNEIYKENHR